MGKSVFRGVTLLIFTLFLASCTPKTEAPTLDNAPSALNIEACKNTSLNFKTLNAQNMRGIVTCLNGSQHSIQAYKDFLDSASTEDLNAVLDAFNYYLPWGSARHSELLELIQVLHQNGYLKGFLNQVQVLGEAQFLHEVVKAALPVWEENSVYNPEPQLEVLYKYIASTMERGVFDDLLTSLEVYSKPNAQTMAALLAAADFNGLGSDKITDSLADLALDMFKDGSFHGLISNLGDPFILKTFQGSSEKERKGFTDVFAYAASRNENDYHYLKRAQLMIGSIQTPVTCFKGQNGQRRAESLLKYLIDEVVGKNQEQTTEFWLKTVPLLFASSQKICDIPQYTIHNYDVVTDMVKAGYGMSYADFWAVLSRNPRFDTLVESLKSVNYVKSALIINEVAQRGALKAFTDITAVDLSSKDAESLAKVLKEASAEPVESSFIKVYSRVLKNQNREELKKLAKALVKTWGDPRGGLGESLKIASDVVKMRGPKPVSDFLTLLFKDQNMINKTSPPFIRLVKNPQFDRVLDLTAKLSGNGDLEKMIVFIAELLSRGSQSSTPQLAKYNYTSSVKAVGELSLQKWSAEEPYSNFGPCLDIKGDLFDPSGENFYKAAQCLNFEGKNPEFVEVAEILKSKNLLPQASKLLSKAVVESPHSSNLLDQLEILLDHGLLTKLLNIYAQMAQPKYGILASLDPLNFLMWSHPQAAQNLSFLSSFMTHDHFNETLSNLSAVVLARSSPVYQSQNQFRLTVKDPVGIKAQIAKWYPNYSAEQVEQIYLKAKENFETHNDAWLYEEGSYQKYNAKEFKIEFFKLLKDLLRTTDLEEFILAFQDYAKDKSAQEFVKYLSDWQMVTQNYSSDGTARVRIQTGLDALENLVLNSDFGYVIMDNVGLSFQIAVVNSNDFVQTMKEQYRLVQLGYNVSGTFGPKAKHYKFKNMIGSFPVLNLIAKNKMMGVLQRLYRAFYNATPEEYKESQDTSLNHISTVNRFNRMGFFENMSMAVQQTLQQGQADQIVSAIVNLALKVKTEDIPYLKQALKVVVDQAEAGKTNAVDTILDLFLALQNDPQNYEKLKTHLLHFATGQDKILPQLSAVIKTLPQLANQKTTNVLINHVFDDLKSDNSALSSFGSNALGLQQSKVEQLKTELSWLMNQKEMVQLLKMYLELYESNPEVIDQFVVALRSFINSPEAQDLQLSQTLAESFLILKDLGPLMGDLLSDPDALQSFVEVNRVLSQSGGLKKISEVLARKAVSGDVEASLHFLFEHFKKSALRFK